MSTPNITTAQIAAFVQAILAVVVSFGLELTQAQQASILGLSAFIALGLTLGDGIIRHGRSRALTAPQSAPAGPSTPPERTQWETSGPTPTPAASQTIVQPPQ